MTKDLTSYIKALCKIRRLTAIRHFTLRISYLISEADSYMGGMKNPEFLIGLGSDDHRIVANDGKSKPVVLAGVVISEEYSPVAHSDGDVVYHAVANALLLAVGERDIGYHFPDTDPDYKGMPGIEILRHSLKAVEKRGYAPSNLTVMITALKPKIAPHVGSMKRNLSESTGMDESSIGIGATTGEGLSAYGKGEGINVVAAVSLRRSG